MSSKVSTGRGGLVQDVVKNILVIFLIPINSAVLSEIMEIFNISVVQHGSNMPLCVF